MRVIKPVVKPTFKSIFMKNATEAVKKKPSTLFFLVVGTGLSLFALNGFSTSKKAEGVSMFPSFEPGTYLIVDRLSARWLKREYDEGDVVVANSPIDHMKSELHPLFSLFFMIIDCICLLFLRSLTSLPFFLFRISCNFLVVLLY
jgi:hypothetical protein